MDISAVVPLLLGAKTTHKMSREWSGAWHKVLPPIGPQAT